MKDIIKSYAGWLYCIREVDKHIGQNQPRLNFSESDLAWIMVNAHYKDRADIKEYDIGYVIPSDGDWHADTKNWTLAIRCFERILEEMPHLKIIIVGRDPPEHL